MKCGFSWPNHHQHIHVYKFDEKLNHLPLTSKLLESTNTYCHTVLCPDFIVFHKKLNYIDRALLQ